MSDQRPQVLLIGYGNPGRLDDGLGPALADQLEQDRLPGLTVDSDYQLTVEDACQVAQHDVVIFADADMQGPEPFGFRALTATSDQPGFSSHSAEPGEILALAESLFGARPAAYLLGIRGYRFDEYGECLSDGARQNLSAATRFIEDVIRSGSFAESASVTEQPPATI